MTQPVRQRLPRNGKSIREAAELTGLGRATIIRWTSAPRDEFLQHAADRRKEARKLRAEGLTMRAIAKRLGVGVGTVHRALHHTDA